MPTLTYMTIYVQLQRFFFIQNISTTHLAIEILHDLGTTVYYVDKNSSGYILARCITSRLFFFEMGKYAELSSEGGCALCTVV